MASNYFHDSFHLEQRKRWSGRLLELCSAFGTEARGGGDLRGTLRTEKVRQRQFCAAILAELAWRTHAPAGGAHHLFGVAAGTERGGLRSGRAHHIGLDGGRHDIGVELWRAIAGLDLFVLSFDVHFVLEAGGVSFEIGRAPCAEVELAVEATHADGLVTFGAEIKLVLNFGPGLLQRLSLLLMPLRTIDLL